MKYLIVELLFLSSSPLFQSQGNLKWDKFIKKKYWGRVQNSLSLFKIKVCIAIQKFKVNIIGKYLLLLGDNNLNSRIKPSAHPKYSDIAYLVMTLPKQRSLLKPWCPIEYLTKAHNPKEDLGSFMKKVIERCRLQTGWNFSDIASRDEKSWSFSRISASCSII